jgi:hypothetical protein
MLVELFSESLQIPPIIDTLLKFSDESRSQRIDPDPSMTQGDDEKQVVFRRGREGGFIDGDFEIEGSPVSFLETDPFVNLLCEVDGLLIQKSIASEALFCKSDVALAIRTFQIERSLKKEMGEDFGVPLINLFFKLSVDRCP